MVVHIFEYGVGNIASLRQALWRIGVEVSVGSSRQMLDKADVFFLPGVGSFPHAMSHIFSEGLDRQINELVTRRKPIIGICLGAQLLFDYSTEGCQKIRGLGLIPGHVDNISSVQYSNIGWRQLVRVDNRDPIFDIRDEDYFYFNHSFSIRCDREFISYNQKHDSDDIAIPAIIKSNNIIGIQFHPEKSQDSGVLLLETLIGAMGA